MDKLRNIWATHSWRPDKPCQWWKLPRGSLLCFRSPCEYHTVVEGRIQGKTLLIRVQVLLRALIQELWRGGIYGSCGRWIFSLGPVEAAIAAIGSASAGSVPELLLLKLSLTNSLSGTLAYRKVKPWRMPTTSWKFQRLQLIATSTNSFGDLPRSTIQTKVSTLMIGPSFSTQ